MQRGWGGGEIYTAFFTRTLALIGVRTVLFINSKANANRWRSHLPDDCEVIVVNESTEVALHLPKNQYCWLLFHTLDGETQIAPLRAAGHFVTCIKHMPLYGRNPDSTRPYELVVPVSMHVLESLRAAEITSGYSEPLYGVADLSRRADSSPIKRNPPYDWDMRKGRDRLLSCLYPIYNRFRSHPVFERKPGITVGIVSRLTPIKQFPLLFKQLAPVLLRHPEVNLEIFGSGGYASVRDLRRALKPIKGQVRFWGHQTDVGTIYRQLDYLLTGLPEKEALGLNVLEAQACGTPVLAVDAPPFTETVISKITGLFYTDPRKDGGLSFDQLLVQMAATPFKIDPEAASAHLQRFSEKAFTERVCRLVDSVKGKIESK